LKFYMKYLCGVCSTHRKHHLEDLDIDGRIILQRIIMKYGMRM
jgi:hypothetical protein